MEPTTGTGTALFAAGLSGLLTAAYGGVQADVVMVMLGSFTGCLIGVSGSKTHTKKDFVLFFSTAILTSLVLAWAIAFMLGKFHHSLQTPYTPTIVAFVIGANSHRLRKITEDVSDEIEQRVRGK